MIVTKFRGSGMKKSKITRAFWNSVETPWNIAPGRSSTPSDAEGPATDLLDLFSASGVIANPQAPPHRAQPLLVECACDLYFFCTILCKRNLELTMEPENEDYCKLKKWTLPNSFLRFHASFPSLKTATWFSKVKTTTWFFHCPVFAQKFHKQDSFLNKKPMFKWQTITYYLILLFLRHPSLLCVHAKISTKLHCHYFQSSHELIFQDNCIAAQYRQKVNQLIPQID